MAEFGGDYTGVPDSLASNETIIFTTGDSPSSGDPGFDVPYEATSFALFTVLLLGQLALGLHHLLRGRASEMKRWPLYFLMTGYLFLTVVCEGVALGYTISVRANRAKDSVYMAYLFFWHASSASMLGMLLALSAGYCITRGELGEYLPRVVGIPWVVFVAGVASDWTFVYVRSTQALSTAGDRYAIVEMSPVEQLVWFFGSLANLMAYFMSWIYVFDSTQLEIKALDQAQQALMGQAQQEDEDSHGDSQEQDPVAAQRRRDRRETDTDDEGEEQPQQRARGQAGGQGSKRSLGTTSQRAGLLYGMDPSTGRQRDVEGGDVTATFADQLEYSVRKRLLTVFFRGVCIYLGASIAIILLPAFFVDIVQNALVVFQFMVKILFTALLAYTFRPSQDSPYLQVGRSDAEAEDRAELTLDTALETELTDRTLAPNNGTATVAPRQQQVVPAVSLQSSAGQAPVRAPVRAPSGSVAVGMGGPSLPVSTTAAGAVGRLPGSARSRGQGQKQVPATEPNPANAKFSLGDDD